MSQKLLRLFAVLLTASLTLAVLIALSVFYNKIAYSSPLQASLRNIQAVDSFQIESQNSHTKLRVRFGNRERLRTNFYLLLEQLRGQSLASLENVTLIIDNKENEALREFLSSARLPIFEAISTGQFTILPVNLEMLSQQSEVKYELELDADFIFLTARTGSEFAHFVINRGESALQIINTMGSEYL